MSLIKIEVKNILGLEGALGPGITKLVGSFTGLVDVVSLYFRNLVERNADADKIKKLEEALNTAGLSINEYSHKDDRSIIKSIDVDQNSLEGRSLQRLIREEIYKQENLEKIISIALKNIPENENPSEDEVSQNWLNQFTESAKQISEEELQLIWGKILADETMSPGSYSIRTLNLIKSLSKKEAEIINKVCSLRIGQDNKSFILKLSHQGNEHIYDISLEDVLLLKELNIFYEEKLFISREIKKGEQCIYNIGCLSIVEYFNSQIKKNKVPVLLFTKVGEEIIKLIDLKEPSKEYIELFTIKLNHKDTEYYLADKNYLSENDLYVVENANKMEFSRDSTTELLETY